LDGKDRIVFNNQNCFLFHEQFPWSDNYDLE